MVKDDLNELKIHCIYIDIGCQEILQLQHLDNHEAVYPEEAVTRFFHYVTIAGGYCSGCVDDMIRMNINPNSDLSMYWSECRVKPAELTYHSSVLNNDHLIVTGGYNGNAVFDCIHEVQLVPLYTLTTLSRMPEPRQFHSTQLFDDNLLIVGGSTTDRVPRQPQQCRTV
ncbi:Kelch repeat type 1-containing [Paramuricea clavata]|uniref:Kelch repeat type 1-containing, partial n=1 Tax=Paramuricea clavata TaxID=317549 RepID=A0A7D9E1T2_PARCT|nr:Kelch repeat type 1-containing [Paramuricea clavata]